MKIVRLSAENFKKLVAVEIAPDGNLVQICGRNGAGKSSILDAMWAALAGASVAPSQPIRKGETQARIRLDLGELVVTRTFRTKDDGEITTAIKVENAEGASYPSPQKMLDGLLGALTFDPLAFARSSPREQFDVLKRFVAGVDFEAIANANRGDYDRRTEINRKAKEARAAAAQIQIPTEIPEPVDEAALLAEMQTAGEHNTAREREIATRTQAGDAIGKVQQRATEQALAASVATERAADLRRQADEFDKKAAEYQAEANKATERATEMQRALENMPPVPDPADLTAIRTRLNEARGINQAAEAAAEAIDRKALLTATAVDLEAQSARLSSAIEIREADKVKAIAAATMPVPGISFGNGFVTLNGVPFEQASDAEQLRASVAIAMADNPKLRVIRVRDGSLLDEDSMKLLAEMADLHDFQCWLEKVDSSGKVGVVIEDGRVKGAAKAAEEAA